MLLEKLAEKQGEMSDQQFSDILGISRSLWSITRRHLQPIGEAVRAGTLRAFPELSAYVLADMQEQGK